MPPVRIRVPQAHAHAGADAAVAALIAHFERRRTGLGQHVDVSMQDSVTLATMFRSLDAAIEQVPARRSTGGVRLGHAFVKNRYALRDGWLQLGPGFLPSTGHFMKRLLRWVAEEGLCDPALVERVWHHFAEELIGERLPPDAFEPVQQALERFFAARTKREMMDAAVERKLLLAPICSLADALESPQLAARGFLVPLPRPDRAGVARFPGPIARFGASPLRPRRGPPRLDEAGRELRAEPLRTPAPCASEPPGRAPLEGVRILDLFWVLAGPGATRMLADYGATVVRVESSLHPDTLRVIPPYHFSHPHVDGAAAFQSANANKLALTLDLGTPAGREVALDLARWADVVTESFAPGVLERYGLGYRELRRVNPEVILLSSCLAGQTGPWRDLTGFGGLAAGVTGFATLAGWPGRPPSGPFGAYTDFVGVRANALAILAALELRERTGRGQHIDQSQAEAALHFLAPAVLDYTVNGRCWDAAGNDDLELSPHGVYPAAGQDRWVAIAVRDEPQWRALCEALGHSDLLGQREDRAVVDRAISAWTAERDALAVERELQARGVPAHAVLDTPALLADAQLAHREHFVEIEHHVYPSSAIESSRVRLSRSSPLRPRRSIEYGRDNRAVLEGILGYSPQRIASLVDCGALR
jgi:crotonobetainyl-CoA:carnitine CoA-transferase CaiB-like acyl-CoA transferase